MAAMIASLAPGAGLVLLAQTALERLQTEVWLAAVADVQPVPPEALPQ